VAQSGRSYEELIRLNGYPFLDGEDGSDMAVARDVMRTQDIVSLALHGNTVGSLGAAAACHVALLCADRWTEQLCDAYHYRGFPVVTNRPDSIVVGFVSRQELLDRLGACVDSPSQRADGPQRTSARAMT
jgi:hypothetical protein